MNKLLLSAALAAGVVSAPAHAGLNSADWANILGAVVEVAGAAATGYAAAQAVQQSTPYMPSAGGLMVYYKSTVFNTDGTRTCLYDDSSWVVVRPGEECAAYFEAQQ